MSEHNRFGLSRDIPSAIKRIVRRNSKFACVICRRGVFVYEHIDPLFADAAQHDSERICCLCGSCHDEVTRGHFSKEYVKAAYASIRAKSPEAVGPVVGPLDFHTGTAVLKIGELEYAPALSSVLVYHGHELFSVRPAMQLGESGAIYAVFADEEGKEIAKIDGNEWQGAAHNWDVEVVQNRLTVRRTAGNVALRLILQPPGTVVIDQLDMRFGDAHLLIGGGTYAVGRYESPEMVSWFHASLRVTRHGGRGRAIEFLAPAELQRRFDVACRGPGKYLARPDGLAARRT